MVIKLIVKLHKMSKYFNTYTSTMTKCQKTFDIHTETLYNN